MSPRHSAPLYPLLSLEMNSAALCGFLYCIFNFVMPWNDVFESEFTPHAGGTNASSLLLQSCWQHLAMCFKNKKALAQMYLHLVQSARISCRASPTKASKGMINRILISFYSILLDHSDAIDLCFYVWTGLNTRKTASLQQDALSPALNSAAVTADHPLFLPIPTKYVGNAKAGSGLVSWQCSYNF